MTASTIDASKTTKTVGWLVAAMAASGSAWLVYQRWLRSGSKSKSDEIFEEIIAARKSKEDDEDDEVKVVATEGGLTKASPTTTTIAPKRLERTIFQRVLVKAVRPLLRSLLPAVVQGNIYELMQPHLRDLLLKLLTTLPPPGIYSTPPDVRLFYEFCKHVQNVMDNSPRTKALKLYKRRCQAAYDDSEDVRWLYTTLGLDRDSDFIPLRDSVEKLTPGLLHKQWYCYHKIATDNPYTSTMIAQIKEGMRAKAVKKKKTITEKDIDLAVEKILRAAEAKRKKAEEEADGLWPSVNADETYILYERVHKIWKEHGMLELQLEYKKIDQLIGEDRRQRGKSFEDNRFDIVFSMVLKRLKSLRKDGMYHYVTGAVWLNSEGKHAGEVDLLLLFTPDERKEENQVVAVVEMKSNCYEISSAALCQHVEKLAVGYKLSAVVQGERKEIEAVTISTETVPPVFVVTTFPEHDYLLGAEPTIIELITDTICGTSDLKIDWEDYRTFEPLALRIRDKMGYDISPEDYVKLHPDQVIIIP